MLVDCHCHLNSLSCADREEFVSSRACATLFFDSSIDYPSSQVSLTLARQYPFVYSCIGFHPFSGKDYRPDLVKQYAQLIAGGSKIAAVGEIGMDYKADIPLAEQEIIFKNFIRLAKEKDLPVVIHNRLLDKKILAALDEFYSSYDKVIFHCFSCGRDFLAEVIEKGAWVSFSLNILRNNKDILSSLAQCPADRLLLETDSPYMKIKDRLSTPLDIRQVYTRAAAVKNIDEIQLQEIIFANVQRAFSL